MRNIEDDIKTYFDEEKIPDINEENLDKLLVEVKSNKGKSRKIHAIRSVLIGLCCVCICLGIFIPLINHFNHNSNVVYYSDATATTAEISVDEVKNLIQVSYPKYNTMFDYCDVNTSVGYYDPDNNELLAVKLSLKEKNIPNTTVDFFLVMSDRLVYASKGTFIEDAERFQNAEYTLYKRTESNTFTELLSGYFIYPTYELYLSFNVINEDLFNIFL